MDFKGAEELETKLLTCTGLWRKSESSKKTSTSASLTTQKPGGAENPRLLPLSGCLLEELVREAVHLKNEPLRTAETVVRAHS